MTMRNIILLAGLLLINQTAMFGDVKLDNATPFDVDVYAEFDGGCKKFFSYLLGSESSKYHYKVFSGESLVIPVSSDCPVSRIWAQFYEKEEIVAHLDPKHPQYKAKIYIPSVSIAGQKNKIRYVKTDVFSSGNKKIISEDLHIYGPVINKSGEQEETVYRISKTIQ